MVVPDISARKPELEAGRSETQRAGMRELAVC